MPMWGSSKSRPTLVINPMEFTRTKLDNARKAKRRGALLKSGADPAAPEAGKDLTESYERAIRINLRELNEAFTEMINARRVKTEHITGLNQKAGELQGLALRIGHRRLAKVAGSLIRLTKTPSKAAAQPDLLKLHVDSLRNLARQAPEGPEDDEFKQMLNALDLAVDSVMKT